MAMLSGAKVSLSFLQKFKSLISDAIILQLTIFRNHM